MHNYYSFTGIVYLPVSFVFVFIAYRFYREYRHEKTLPNRDITLYFTALALICFSGALAGTVFANNRAGIIAMLIGSSLFLTFANALLGHLYFLIKYPQKSAMWGFVPLFIYGLLITVLTSISPMHPRLEASGGLDWGLPSYIDYLRASVYLLGTVPISLVYLRKYQRSQERTERSGDMFLLMIFAFSLLVVITDFIIEPLLATDALLSEEVLLFFAVVGMVLYFWLNEYSLSQFEERLDLAVKGAAIGLWDWSIPDRKMVINDQFARILGYRLEELSPTPIDTVKQMIHPDDLTMLMELLQKHFQRETAIFMGEIRIKHKAGQWIWVAERGKVVTRDSSGKPVRMAGTQLDITDRKVAEAKLINNLNEKENLLQEVYHRTKNNMNVIISLLNMQERELSHREIDGVLHQVANRIYSMSLVHEQLYHSQNFATVRLDEYIKTLIRHLQFSLKAGSSRIEIQIECSLVELGLNQAVPLGLVLNEILTNSYKHAFPSTAGKINLRVQQNQNTEVQIDIKDDGVGFPAEIDPEISETMGLKIIRMLVKDQLSGKLTIQSHPGVHYQIVIAKPAEHIKSN